MADESLAAAEERWYPVLYPEEAPFWDGARRGELVLQKCDECEKVRYPIGPSCPDCLSTEFTWTTLSGQGQVRSYVVYHRAWAPWLEKQLPYAVVQVELAEGPRLTTNLLGITPDEVHVGMKVEATYEDIGDNITLVQFEPAANA